MVALCEDDGVGCKEQVEATVDKLYALYVRKPRLKRRIVGRTHDEKDIGERDEQRHDRKATGTRSLTTFVELAL